MEVTFAEGRLKRACENASERQRKWGDPAGDRAGHFSCRVNKSLRLIVRPTRQPPPGKEDGGLDWSQIDQVTVTEVVDYHD